MKFKILLKESTKSQREAVLNWEQITNNQGTKCESQGELTNTPWSLGKFTRGHCPREARHIINGHKYCLQHSGMYLLQFILKEFEF